MYEPFYLVKSSLRTLEHHVISLKNSCVKSFSRWFDGWNTRQKPVAQQTLGGEPHQVGDDHDDVRQGESLREGG